MRAHLRKRIERIERIVTAIQHASPQDDLVRVLQRARWESGTNPGEEPPEQQEELRQRARTLRRRLKTLLRIEELKKLNR